MSNDLDQQVEAEFCSVLNISPAESIHSVVRQKSKRWDSIRHVELIIRLQRKLGISFPMHEIGKLNTLQDLQVAVRAALRK